MLHILWLILKFILILLGILLGLFLLAVLLLLFCPVRYQASAVKEDGNWKQVQAGGAVSWLFHGISLKAEWKNGELQTVFYLFGIPVSRLLEKHKGKKALKTMEVPKVTKTSRPMKTQDTQNAKVPQSRNEKKAEINDVKSGNSKGDGTENKKADFGINDVLQRSTDKNHDINKDTGKNKDIDNPAMNNQAFSSQEKSEAVTAETEKASLYQKLADFIRNKTERIRQKLKKIRQTLQKIRRNVHWWRDFLEHPRVKAAISLVWKHAKFLLKHIFPTRTEGKIIFSSEDPALTGMILAVLGMTIPFHKNCIEVVPLFNGENDLRGNVSVKGRIYGFVFVRAAIVIYFDKNIKYVIKRWKTRRA